MENLKLIQKITWSFHKSTGFDWDDIFQEACIYYLRALQSHDLKKGKLSTYVWSVVVNNLIYKISTWKREIHLSYEESNAYEIPMEFSPFWEKLSDEASEVADFVLANPSMFVCLTATEAEEIAKYVLEAHGWSEYKIQQGINDLKTVCNQL